MTDASLMDANCIHGFVWYECEQCGREMSDLLNDVTAEDIKDLPDYPSDFGDL